VSFVNTLNGDQGGVAVIATTTNIMSLDPETGQINILLSMAEALADDSAARAFLSRAVHRSRRQYIGRWLDRMGCFRGWNGHPVDVLVQRA
jgi:hypothetical protein